MPDYVKIYLDIKSHFQIITLKLQSIQCSLFTLLLHIRNYNKIYRELKQLIIYYAYHHKVDQVAGIYLIRLDFIGHRLSLKICYLQAWFHNINRLCLPWNGLFWKHINSHQWPTGVTCELPTFLGCITRFLDE